MFSKVLLTTSLAVLCNVASAGFGPGKCSTPVLQENFSATGYLGRWFEVKRDKALPFEKDATCVTADYSLIDATTLGVLNRQFNSVTGKDDSITGSASCNGPACVVSFPPPAPRGDYRVVSTDYTSYSIVYSCTEFGE